MLLFCFVLLLCCRCLCFDVLVLFCLCCWLFCVALVWFASCLVFFMLVLDCDFYVVCLVCVCVGLCVFGVLCFVCSSCVGARSVAFVYICVCF